MAGTSPAIILCRWTRRMPVISAFAQTAGAAPRLQLRARLRNPPERFADRPSRFVARLPISVAVVARFVFMIALPKRALGQWHESEIGADS
jgi:hypothetical protein